MLYCDTLLEMPGKGKWIFKGHGYWFHGFMGNLSLMNPFSAATRLRAVKVWGDLFAHLYNIIIACAPITASIVIFSSF